MAESRILRTLTAQDLAPLVAELEVRRGDYGGHYLAMTPESAPLRHGKSLYVYALNLLTLKPLRDERRNFPATLKRLEEITGESADRLGRVYWHRLEPGERIDLHQDVDPPGGKYFQSIRRYQIYLQVPEGAVVVIDGKLWNRSPEKMLSHAVLDFNFADWHYYANDSEEPMEFLVADFFRESARGYR